MNNVIVWQRLEGAFVFLSGIAIYIFFDANFSWWLALLLFFAPDLTFGGYLLGARIGAICYNLVHIFAFGTTLIALGLVVDSVTVAALGALWLAHSGFDRMFGYGLKSAEGFHETHLGKIGTQSIK